jgi:peroxiredoxin
VPLCAVMARSLLVAGIAILMSACGGPAVGDITGQASPQHYDGGTRGFTIDLAPGWKQDSEDMGSVNFVNSSQQATMRVHVELAVKSDLDTLARRVLLQLTGDVPTGRPGETTLSGLPATMLRVESRGKGGSGRTQAVVAQQGNLVWALVLTGLRSAFGQSQQDFQRMVQSFRIGGQSPSPMAQVAIGLPAPDSPTLGLSHLQGPLVIAFFATSCDSCADALGLLRKRAAGNAGRYQVLVVDVHDDPHKAQAALSKLGVSFPVRYDTDRHVYQTYGLHSLPATFFLDSGHMVRDRWLGPLDDVALTQGLDAIK